MYKIKMMTGKKCFLKPFYNKSVGSGLRPWKWTITFDWLFFDLTVTKIGKS